MVLLVNGRRRQVDADPRKPLLFVLRDELDLTGTKYGCGEGQCGACTVLLNGKPVRSCQIDCGAVSGHTITTIEGLAEGEHLHPVQQSFLDCDALQCGYCTSGMILSSVALLRQEPTPTTAQIKAALEGNVCRCGTYNRIVAAVRLASKLTAADEREKKA
ncbi:MAG TPA: (2Fe-2S)-binding protein [Bryobacteraceae bacterium]|nr:(2Fe-2S)-binding protein [Bryobacteraceae bacterium]